MGIVQQKARSQNMSNQESTLKEANELLENAQKEVLKEINNKRNLFSRLFNGGESESLKQAQSAISKAINQMKIFNKDESSLVVKLQNHLNDKNQTIKKMEEQLQSCQKDNSELKDKIRFYEAEIETFKKNNAKSEAENKTANEERRTESKIDENLQNKIESLENTNRDFQSRFKASQEDLASSQKLNVELNARIKRLKAELVS